MDANRVALTTAEHLFRLYAILFSSTSTKEKSIASAAAATESYLVECGMSHAEAAWHRQQIMLMHTD
ncbi:hypothetical protein AUC44_02185 [Deinococcus actinosclerus]|uniref:Uncharacterized protein n=1 Tax=Deinococcus actinosclerus TaxID=1768108 RepID=A0ABM5X2I8_9DEIO|nr:hypothetical protein AUC44_02185 [Deinococcus actinosclerus]